MIKKPVEGPKPGESCYNLLDADGDLLCSFYGSARLEVDEMTSRLNEVKVAINGRDAVIAYISDVKNGIHHKAFNDLMRLLAVDL